ncbi:MAG: VanW family protein [Clostridiales bacterium]|nr:VanW family protein [Clostridiales bacterium]
MKNFSARNRARAALLLALFLLLALPGALAAQEVLYNAKISTYFPNSITNAYQSPDLDSKVMTSFKPGQAIQIVEVLPNFVGILVGNKTGYVLRHRIMDPVALDPANTPRFGTAFNRYFTTASREIQVLAAPEAGSQVLITLQAGARLGFLDVENGWARTIFKRQYGYVDTRTLTELEMVAASEQDGTSEVPIAVYNSFYDISDNENNQNRISNLVVGGQRMSLTLEPGQSLDFNNQVGPFRASNGYKPAGALVDGELVFDVYGGGSCQVSSTLYNVILQLNGVTVLRRAPHGANGIKYLPHGVDASSGMLNLVFRNDYSFPISITAHVQDGSLFVAIYKDS